MFFSGGAGTRYAVPAGFRAAHGTTGSVHRRCPCFHPSGFNPSPLRAALAVPGGAFVRVASSPRVPLRVRAVKGKGFAAVLTRSFAVLSPAKAAASARPLDCPPAALRRCPYGHGGQPAALPPCPTGNTGTPSTRRARSKHELRSSYNRPSTPL